MSENPPVLDLAPTPHGLTPRDAFHTSLVRY